jgi:hypothetical protein
MSAFITTVSDDDEEGLREVGKRCVGKMYKDSEKGNILQDKQVVISFRSKEAPGCNYSSSESDSSSSLESFAWFSTAVDMSVPSLNPNLMNLLGIGSCEPEVWRSKF